MLYNYKFVDNNVELENDFEKFVMPYDQWCKEYYVVDKWKSLKIKSK